MNWKEAVWQAAKRVEAQNKPITRQLLIEQELPAIMAQVGSKGATPEQTLSRVLQELRDDAVLIFDGKGRYRIPGGLAQTDVDTAAETEAMRLQACRLGQGSFRRKLDARWNGTCPLTGITDRALLRAAHVVPWNRCESAAERLSVDNGLLLSALWDAAFDCGLAAFDDDGGAMFAARIDRESERALRQARQLALPPLPAPLRSRLHRHRMLHTAMGLRTIS